MPKFDDKPIKERYEGMLRRGKEKDANILLSCLYDAGLSVGDISKVIGIPPEEVTKRLTHTNFHKKGRYIKRMRYSKKIESLKYKIKQMEQELSRYVKHNHPRFFNVYIFNKKREILRDVFSILEKNMEKIPPEVAPALEKLLILDKFFADAISKMAEK